jgi:integrase
MGILKRNVKGKTVYYEQFYVGDKRIRRSLGTSDKAEALKLSVRRELEREEADAQGIESAGTLSPTDAWAQYVAKASRHKRERTLQQENSYWRQFWAHTSKRNLYNVTKDDVFEFQDWYRTSISRNGRPRSLHTVNDALRNIGVAISNMREMGIYTGPNYFSAKEVKRIKTAKLKPKWLSKTEIETLLEAAGAHSPDMHMIYALGFYAGLRKGEMLGLRWGDVIWDRKDQNGKVVGCINIEPYETLEGRPALHELKTVESERVIPLADKLRAVLEHYKPLSDNPERLVLRPLHRFIPGKRYRWEFKRTFSEVAECIELTVSL